MYTDFKNFLVLLQQPFIAVVLWGVGTHNRHETICTVWFLTYSKQPQKIPVITIFVEQYWCENICHKLNSN